MNGRPPTAFTPPNPAPPGRVLILDSAPFRPLLPVLALAAALLLPAIPVRSQETPLPREGPAGAGLSLGEAIDLALTHDPNLDIAEARLRSSRGALLGARGLFDPVVDTTLAETESNLPSSTTSSTEARTLSQSLGVTKLFRTGLSLQPELSLDRAGEPGAGGSAANLGTVALNVRQPLLRGRGRDVVAGAERSAERELAASGSDLRFTTSERLLVVATRYWEARAAFLNTDILRASEGSARALLATTRRLIEADVTPAAERVQVEANLAFKEAALIAGERDAFAARQELGREIGLDRAGLAALPPPTDPFPTVAPPALPDGAEASFVAEAVARRDDLRAARERRDAVEALVAAAEDGLEPRLDLVFTPSWTGFVQGGDAGDFFSPLYRNVPGASSSLSLAFSWPTWNRRARGDLEQVEAARDQSRQIEQLVRRGVEADVATAVDAVRRHAEQLERATEAVRLFERAVENEEKKLTAGTSTLLDVISQRDRLTSAQQAHVAAQLALAVALARLRFETGTLLAEGDLGERIDPARLTTVPIPEAPAAPPKETAP
jgi:outer membrane protein